jgi:hypothetical protein
MLVKNRKDPGARLLAVSSLRRDCCSELPSLHRCETKRSGSYIPNANSGVSRRRSCSQQQRIDVELFEQLLPANCLRVVRIPEARLPWCADDLVSRRDVYSRNRTSETVWPAVCNRDGKLDGNTCAHSDGLPLPPIVCSSCCWHGVTSPECSIRMPHMGMPHAS